MIIPFFIPHAGCPHQCVFCDQKSITGKSAPPDPSSIPSTISSYLAAASSDGPVQVAFYGGSFTALPADLQRSYLEAVQPFRDAGTIESIRLSTRPDAITPDILALLERYHIGTVELGVQSMNDDVLFRSGRGHTSADTVNAVSLLKSRGFRIGLQLMPGLPGDTAGRFHETVRQVIGLGPDLVRIYPTIVIKDTPLAELYRRGNYAPLSLDDAVDLCRDAVERFEAAGIAVVRVGLQPTEELERPGTVIAGPWHPAFRQLVESSRFLQRMVSCISPGAPSGPITFHVNPADLSSAIGQNRANVHAISERHDLDARIAPDPAVPRGAVRTFPSCNSAAAEV